MSKYTSPLIVIVITFFLLFSCTKKQAEEPKPITPEVPGTPGASGTYATVVDPLFQTRCAGCHAPGKRAAGAWTFNGYSSVNANADKIKQVVLVSKTMPVGGTLTAAELQSLKDWFDKGMPQ
ncbi:putative membrane protein [Pedobacter cryoconitis]|uniref:c-type cytochrome n=1 Tax=Pedobacter cryoconitis TaxID=188932 RepID=UPI0016075C8B|nr:cytochrome c [Pedobacter cryoconitis]MBB6274253.1 putative membrane protein [Pedobacter cryoconitis]